MKLNKILHFFKRNAIFLQEKNCNRSRRYIWGYNIPMYTIYIVYDLTKIPTDSIYSVIKLLVHYIWTAP